MIEGAVSRPEQGRRLEGRVCNLEKSETSTGYGHRGSPERMKDTGGKAYVPTRKLDRVEKPPGQLPHRWEN